MPHSRRLRLAAAPLAVAAALAFAACGGDDEETIALSDWIAQADEICSEGDADLNQEITEFFDGTVPDQPDPGQLEDLATEVFVPTFQSQHDQISDLPSPDQDADKADEMLAALQSGITQLESDPSLVTTEDGPEGFQEASRLADEIGLEECGE